MGTATIRRAVVGAVPMADGVVALETHHVVGGDSGGGSHCYWGVGGVRCCSEGEASSSHCPSRALIGASAASAFGPFGRGILLMTSENKKEPLESSHCNHNQRLRKHLQLIPGGVDVESFTTQGQRTNNRSTLHFTKFPPS
jgi:hypothetical protein